MTLHRACEQLLCMGQRLQAPKKPYVFELANGNPIGFAGLWDAWKDKEGHWHQAFAIVTTRSIMHSGPDTRETTWN